MSDILWLTVIFGIMLGLMTVGVILGIIIFHFTSDKSKEKK